MYNTRWLTKTLFAEAPECRGIVALSLVGWLLMVVVVAKMFIGCSASLHQAAMPFDSQVYKLAESSFDDAEPVEKITLSSCIDIGIVFPEKDFFADLSESGARSSVHDVSELAKIGQSFSIVPVKQTVSLSRSTLLNPVIRRAAALYEVDPALVRAIIFAESGYNPRAVSKRGAMGLMQLMPDTAKAMGVEDCFDPEHNIYGGVKYFKKLFIQFDGDVKLALAAYNAGSRKVRQFNGVPPFRATEHYIQKVLKYYNIYKSQQAQPVGLS